MHDAKLAKRHLGKKMIKFFCTFRFNLQRGWTSTIFVLNLAVVDLFYCTVTMPIFATWHLSKGWIWGENVCTFVAAIVTASAMTEWGSLGMIAVSKCIGLLNAELADKLFIGLRGKLFIAMIWIYTPVPIKPCANLCGLFFATCGYFQESLQNAYLIT